MTSNTKFMSTVATGAAALAVMGSVSMAMAADYPSKAFARMRAYIFKKGLQHGGYEMNGSNIMLINQINQLGTVPVTARRGNDQSSSNH